MGTGTILRNSPDGQEYLRSLDKPATVRAGSLSLIEDDDGDASVNVIRQGTRTRAAMDSGSCRNVAHPKTLPTGVKVTPNTTGKHFSGAVGAVIEKFGECVTTLEGSHGSVGCRWDVAYVTRPLHSASPIAGPYGGDGGQDVLFNNKRSKPS